ncbi:MAG: hypothetical protein IPP19_03710 [Verrucomicrobia bacterium]|nr:hypothetical protein [Verrucomicrobiota bacterium]
MISLPVGRFLTRSLKISSIALSLLLGVTASAKKPEPAAAASTGPAAFTDSSAAGLVGTKRVAITNVMISFQASTGAQTSTNGMLAHKSDTSSVLQMPDMDTALLAAITDAAYAQLKTDLAASGFEVLPEATVVASPSYQKIIKLAGIANFSKFANREGDIMLVGATGLHPYFPYVAEGGGFNYPSTTRYIKGWVSSMSVASSTEGGPSATSIKSTYELPGLEIALAKELNAHVVKATYVVTLGSTKAAVSGRFSHHNTHTGEAFAQVSLKAGQSRIAFRTAAGKAKGQSVSVSKPLPARTAMSL